MTRTAIAVATLLATIAIPANAQDMTAPQYPETQRDDVVETFFGEQVADPYRWLEEDVRNSEDVAKWVTQQNRVTDAYLEQLPARPWFNTRIGELYDYERFSVPVERGGRYFYTSNSGLQNQSPLYVRDGLNGVPRLLLDPNQWAEDGATALSDWVPSPDGSKLLYSVQDGGSDWRILRVLDVTTGEQFGGDIRWAKFTGLAWVGEEGFLYSRFPEPEEGEDFQALNLDQAVYFHELGTDQSADSQIYATPDHPERNHVAQTSDDGRWVILTSSTGTDARHEVHVVDLSVRETRGWRPQPLVTGFENSWSLIDSVGSRLFFVTNTDAPLYRVLSIDMDNPSAGWSELIAERDQPIAGASMIGDRLVIQYLEDASSSAYVYTLGGEMVREIEFTGLGSAGGFYGSPDSNETFYSFTSFNRPATIYRYDVTTGETSEFAAPDISFDPDDFVVEQQFYESKDGTRVPMFIVRRADIAASGDAVPTLLYGYGGFDISLTPGFSPSRMAWVEAGGAYAVANLRGGGEYGKAWHDAGRRANKQNVFDDFISAGEYLIAQGITPEDGLAIQGGSNGGLLVGAVVNQRPDLFAAGNAAVGVMDMLRFDQWTAGRYWVDDYGYPDREEDWRILRAYSPLHNIQSGAQYPALLVTTADTDDRVVPGHSFKYTAALQAEELGDRPQLIRIETRAGHGSGKPTDKAIAEAADILSFLGYWTGLKVGE
ncbi:prolyl endopeptidase [Aurantiacibacter atlanticus]|uniref:prolyl oligopeptidase n=1 Tax=Aurantiacibacter atlanticus TaxID=1648404 RepID=A0A0H4VXM8_9SPHN|nr:prolyl oligopeptidase family serine peptidase [Aurantiacibacter atlanticus]AKQ41868.1 prolyl endopeptidase [Aurantiacibacter atlanticus]MDF1834037.1 prolyl oligopeptidase family serine peptidase [Alteraurantiacibacter sp. bin_em_oilr2.035]